MVEKEININSNVKSEKINLVVWNGWDLIAKWQRNLQKHNPISIWVKPKKSKKQVKSFGEMDKILYNIIYVWNNISKHTKFLGENYAKRFWT